MKTQERYEQIIQRITDWANKQKDISTVIIAGSRARTNLPADEWSDLDIMIFAKKPGYYIYKSDWINNIGNSICNFMETGGVGGGRERRVLFEGMLDVDFSFGSNAELKSLIWLVRIQKHFSFLLKILPKKMKLFIREVDAVRDILKRGMRMIIDKENISKYISLFASQPIMMHIPSQQEFLELVNSFLYHVVWTAKHLKRGELWWAKSSLDIYLKLQILTMIEWHSKSINGLEYDTWMNGRFLEKWADPRAIEALKTSFAYYDKDDMKKALYKTAELFQWLAMETAQNLKYEYPIKTDDRIREWLNEVL